ncbi:MAG: pseudouridine synthase [Deferrisomatales bacterium]|nr:pseudouridine synthase [Deferrisomatales bacterium]
MPLERLQKLLASRGLCSRREAEEWVRAGRVRVNGLVVRELGVKADPESDRVEVDGKPLPGEARHFVVVLNKPIGYVSTVRDPHAEHTVMELLERVRGRVYPVGRLDRDSRGVLLLTNDGDLAHQLLHPRHQVEKVYEVTAAGDLGPEGLARLSAGLELDDGPTAPARVWAVCPTASGVRFRIALKEGRKRQVRRMVQHLGGHVVDLVRLSVGPVTAEGLAEGAWRYLKPDEVEALRRGDPPPGPSETGRRSHGRTGRSKGTNRGAPRRHRPGGR